MKAKLNKLYDFTACVLFIAAFMVIYRDILFLNGPFMGVNFVVPAVNMDYYFTGLFSNWFPGLLGFPSQPGWWAILQFIFAIITGNNLTLISKLLLGYTPIAALSMYFLLLKHFNVSRPARFTASLIFAFSPSIVFDFTDISLWGYATLPIVFNYMLNLLNYKKSRKRDILIFSLALAFTIEFIPQVLPVLVSSFFIFVFIRLITASQKMEYLITTAKRFVPSIVLFTALSFQTIRGIIIYVLGGAGLAPPNPDVTVFYYSAASFVNTFRVIGGDYLSMVYQYPNATGFVIPIIAFASLLLVRKREQLLNLISLSFIVVSILWLAYSIKENMSWFVWLSEHAPFLKLMVAPQRPLYLVSFAYSCMIGVTIHEVVERLKIIKIPVRKKLHVPNVIRKDVIITIIISFLVISANFLYNPYFDTYMQRSLYYPLPSSYNDIISWLNSKDPSGNYRVLIVPTLLDFPPDLNQFGRGSLGVGESIAIPYVDFVYNAFVQGKTRNLGSLLALSATKYIIVNLEPPDFGHYVDSITRFSRTGPIRVEDGALLGNASNYIKFLDEQNDLQRVAANKNFVVYLNKMFVPHLSVYSNSAFIVGNMDGLYTLTEFPNFKVNSILPILGYQNVAETRELVEASSTIVFFNTGFNDLLMLLSLPRYGMNFSSYGLQQGWTFVPINGSYSSYSDGYIFTNTPRNLTIDFKVDMESTYELWLRVLFTANASDLGVLIDGKNLHVIRPNAFSNLGFQWVNIGSINLSSGIHTLKLVSYGFNAIDDAVMIPSGIMREINLSATNILGDKKVLFISDFHASTFNVTVPAGEYWIALKQSSPIHVTPTMGMIALDSAQSFIISRENFKPARDPPYYDFDNANYYFYTKSGANVEVEFTGSALASVWISYNVTDISKWHGENQVFLLKPQLVENRTFYFEIPPNSVFQPVIYAFNPDMHQSIQDNMSKITIKNVAKPDSPILAIDDVNVTRPTERIENGAWVQYGPIRLTSGEHKITLYQPFQANQPVAIYNTANLSEVFSTGDGDVHYNVTKVSESEYYVDINTDTPVFLALAESYHPNWVAEVDGQQLPHYVVSSFSNGFYLNKTGAYKITLKFQPTFQNLINFIQELSWAILGLILVGWPLSYKIMRQLKNKKLKNTSIQESKHETDN